MGEVLGQPFRQEDLNGKLAEMLRDDDRERWFEIGRRFAANADIYSLHKQAASRIEGVAFEQLDLKANLESVVAFCLFKYFPYGGLQRDFLRIALEAKKLGYRIRVYTLMWEGEIPTGFEVIIVPISALTNHSRYRRYHGWVSNHLSHWPVALVVGFNKMPGLDLYFAADPCFLEKADKQRGSYYTVS